MDKWFANKAQVVQVACAIIAVMISLMVWLAIPASSLVYHLAPVFVVIGVGWIVWITAVAYTNDHQARMARLSFSSTPSTSLPNPPARPTYAVTPTIAITKITCNVGALWEGNILGRDFRIVINGIKKVREQSNYRADVEIRGAGTLHGGDKTQSISSARYWVDSTPSPFNSEHSMLFFFVVHPLRVEIFTLRVDHIDPKSNQVNLELCVVVGTPMDGTSAI
jgi:hypothetical protein